MLGVGARKIMGLSQNIMECSLKSFYEKFLVRGGTEFPCNAIWIRRVPRKVCLFTWLDSRGES